jgi:hypothetical protein
MRIRGGLGVGFEEFAEEGGGVFAEHARGREIASVYAHNSSIYNHMRKCYIIFN